MRILVIAACLSLVITRCTATPSTSSPAQPLEAQGASNSCSVTTPRRVGNVRDGVPFDPSYVIGSDKFWTEVAAENIVVAEQWLVQPDGSIRVKWPWLYQDQVKGDLKVVGQLVDEPNGSSAQFDLVQDINPAQFPDLEAGLAASVSYMVFPSTGCWNVVATKGSEQIQFITEVVEP